MSGEARTAGPQMLVQVRTILAFALAFTG